MKKFLGVLLIIMLSFSLLVGCGNNANDKTDAGTTASNNETPSFDASKEINVISREDGSGTRGAFVELTGIEEDKVDRTTPDASIQNSTGVVLTTVAGNKYSIGYISLGSLNDSVKAVKVDGVEATTDNVANNSYKIARPFNIATKGAPSAEAQDFINYILSESGQKIVEEAGYISTGNKGAFTSTNPSGKITVAGSSSVSPVMEKLVEAYGKVNANLEIELQTSDSSAGMTSAKDGAADIGMASRELKDSEKESLTPTVIAMDGIAVIVNKDNTTDNLTSEQIKNIYIGDVTKWSEVQ